jgi:sec-independent protein translocase protein TatA
MGFGGISLWQLLIVLLIVVVIFGTARLRSIGTDLGGALRGFRKAMSDDENDVTQEPKKIDEPDADFGEARKEEQPADHKHSS